MKKHENSHTNASGVFPDTLAIDATSPSATDGTEYIAEGINEWWGWTQALLDEGGITPSGSTEVKGTSDLQDALKSLFWFDNLITGLVCSNNVTDAQHDIDITTGKAMDSTNAYLMKLDSGLIKQIDASWAVGTNAGGLFTGTVAADTWYAVHLIRKDSDGSIDVGFDTSATAVNIPVGYTYYRRIGWVLTDSSSNIYAFEDNEMSGGGSRRTWKDAKLDSTAGTTPITRTLVTISAPVDQLAQCNFRYGDASSGFFWAKETFMTDTTPSGTDNLLFAGTSTVAASSALDLRADSSSQIAIRANSAGTGYSVFTTGYTDNRL